jgi:8-oxo-dGTP pyrophosphatase MutT (NUDIX family)
MSDAKATSVYEGRHLSMFNRGGWEYAKRNTARPAVGIVAVTDDGKVVLVEQHRPPVGRNVIELPAGLSGDIAGSEEETLLEAAQRELLEETGYVGVAGPNCSTGTRRPASPTSRSRCSLRRASAEQAREGATLAKRSRFTKCRWTRCFSGCGIWEQPPTSSCWRGCSPHRPCLRTEGRCGHE